MTRTDVIGHLVFAATTAALEAAPTMRNDAFTSLAPFDRRNQQVDAYWAAHLLNQFGRG
jgi:hypothetical protein